MIVCVQGLWHLGTVTAACLAAANIRTIGLAEDDSAANDLSLGRPPLFEPGLSDLLASGLRSGMLSFTADPAVVGDADLIWVNFDTPVDNQDRADVDYVCDRIRALFPHLPDGAVVLISAQVPVGSTARLELDFAKVATGRRVSFAYSPENLRLGQAIKAFTEAERIIIGVRDDRARAVIEPVLAAFCPQLIWMRVESAKMVKHSLNAYLATCITLTNELASISEQVGSDFAEVEQALRLDPRIGARAYVRAGGAFGGGTLARDVLFLEGLAAANGLTAPLISSIRASNSNHREWVTRQLKKRLGTLVGKRIGLLGLAYKAGTDAIRRSVAVELGQAVAAAGGEVVAFDPKVATLPPEFARSIKVAVDPEAVFAGSDGVMVGTEWPDFRGLALGSLVATMRKPIIVDQNGFLRAEVATIESDVDYVLLGKAQ